MEVDSDFGLEQPRNVIANDVMNCKSYSLESIDAGVANGQRLNIG